MTKMAFQAYFQYNSAHRVAIELNFNTMASATVSTGIMSLSDDDVRVIPETPTKADLDIEETGEGVNVLDVTGAVPNPTFPSYYH